eukprot:TRINITY_DN7076_c0_g1_i1.p1 TRINITY_DN7076_c0_g1~~TRINITY_DN7076_c0_g1_i1.p1  ORF type:complete len:375 (+),score=101.22 TRINITY_DN7076_c0_g1_i1:140-1264(+)
MERRKLMPSGHHYTTKSWLPEWRDPKEDSWQALWRCAVSEFFAVAIFVFLGCGSVVAAHEATLGSSSIEVSAITLIAMAHGFTIMCMIYTIGEISGGHINPIVTWAVLFTHKLTIVRALVYWVSQILGGIIGSALLMGLLPEQLRYPGGCHELNPSLNKGQGLGLEIVFTFILVLVVFSTAISPFVGKMAPLSGGDHGPGKLTPFVVGMTVMILHDVGIPLTGASMNPARSFGPAVVLGCWDDHWIYWLGPWIGSTLAALTAQVVFLARAEAMLYMFTNERDKYFGPGLEPVLEGESERGSERSSIQVEVDPNLGNTLAKPPLSVDRINPNRRAWLEEQKMREYDDGNSVVMTELSHEDERIIRTSGTKMVSLE